MSGLCAVLDLAGERADLAHLRVAAGASVHRGADGIAYWIRDAVGLAHLALRSTPEAEGETQPTISDDRRLCLAADARIDHRHRLTDELREAGTLRAAHPTDAQLILAAYERWVEECPAHLEGDFAFALWDGRKRQLFCACDPWGARSLHFARFGNTLWVATDPAQLLALPGASRSIDPWWVVDYLLDIQLEPQRSPFDGVERIPAGHHLIASRGDVRLAPTPRAAGEELHADFSSTCLAALRSSAPVIGLAVDGGPAGDLLAATVDGLVAETAPRVELLTIDHRSVEPPSLAAPAIDSPYSGWRSAERELLRRLANCGARVLLTTQGGSAAAPEREVVAIPGWLNRDLVQATDLEGRRRAAKQVGPTTHNSYPRAVATDSLGLALRWQERIAGEQGIEVRHPFLAPFSSDQRLPPDALRGAAESRVAGLAVMQVATGQAVVVFKIDR